MAYSVLPISGVDLNEHHPNSFAYTNGATCIGIPSFGPLGAETFGSDGKRYVFAQAGGSYWCIHRNLLPSMLLLS